MHGLALLQILQAIGGGAKALAVPNTSASFTWTPKCVATSAGKGAIYIWAQEDLALNPTDDAEEDSEDDKKWM